MEPLSMGEWVFYLLSASISLGGFAFGLLWLRNKLFPHKSQVVNTEVGSIVATRNVATSKPMQPVAQVGGNIDMRIATLQAVNEIPAQVPFLQSTGGNIPLLFDGTQWHNVQLGKDGHWGIFGTTGSGKGNALQIIALATLETDNAQLVVLDAKGGLDYGFCKHTPSATLYAGVRLSGGCDAIIAELYRRIELLEAVGARNLHEYNQRVTDKLPLYVVIADEIADFTKEDRAKVETFARMARAVGGVLFVATQYPTVDVLSNQIQSNVTNRCVFRLASSEYTRVALRRQKSDHSMYEPSAIPQDRPGVAVLRRDAGSEYVGRAPELSDSLRDVWIESLCDVTPSVCLSENGVSAIPHQDANRPQTDHRQTTQTDRDAIAVALIRDGKNRDEVRAMFRRMGWGLDNNEYTRYAERAKSAMTA